LKRLCMECPTGNGPASKSYLPGLWVGNNEKPRKGRKKTSQPRPRTWERRGEFPKKKQSQRKTQSLTRKERSKNLSQGGEKVDQRYKGGLKDGRHQLFRIAKKKKRGKPTG